MADSFNIDISGVLEGLSEVELRTRMALGLYGDTSGKKLAAKAKKDAQWEDRSGQARQTIEGGSEWEGDKIDIYVAGNKDYSPYLEFANEKKYSVLKPTVDEMTSEILEGLANIIE